MAKRNSKFRSRQARYAGGARVEHAPREAVVAESSVEPAQQYRYVLEDLSRVGIIAAFLIGVMVLLRIFVIK